MGSNANRSPFRKKTIIGYGLARGDRVRCMAAAKQRRCYVTYVTCNGSPRRTRIIIIIMMTRKTFTKKDRRWRLATNVDERYNVRVIRSTAIYYYHHRLSCYHHRWRCESNDNDRSSRKRACGRAIDNVQGARSSKAASTLYIILYIVLFCDYRWNGNEY